MHKLLKMLLAPGILILTGALIWQSSLGFADSLRRPIGAANHVSEIQLIGAKVSPAVSPHHTAHLPTARISSEADFQEIEVIPLRQPRRSAQTTDFVLSPGLEQPLTDISQVDMPAPLVNFEGLNAANILPPDTNGQAGLNHYVQMVNDGLYGSRVGVWEKSGNFLYAFGLSQLWPTSDNCALYPRGDPIVLYDQLADRWLLSQFTDPPSPPYNECVAISKTSTPTNNPADWYVYTFDVHPSKLNDYPKLSVWPDAYYMTANQFVITTFPEQWAGVGVWALDREAMLNGLPAVFQYFDLAELNPQYSSLLPAGLLGKTLPPHGAPGYFVSVDMDWYAPGSDDLLHLFEFQVNWDNPASSSFRLVKDLVTQPFDWSLSAGSLTYENIPQPDTTQKLDDLADRLMMSFWYRNFESFESLTVNHTIDANFAPPTTSGRAGIRWYELRGGAVNATLADAQIHQQGTIGLASTLHRWMGSLAMDQAGNMALGYSVSSSTVYPGIRYTGRLAGDLPGSMPQAETVLMDGSGSQLDFRGRWGDYTAMSLDPVDDCTFWYTNQYIQTTAQVNWRTRIAAFRFPNCTTEPTFYLDLTPASQEICVAASAQYNLLALSQNGFSESVVLSGSGPVGTTLDFTQNPITPPDTTTINVSSTAGLAEGSYSIVITGTTGTITQTETALLEILSQPPAALELLTPADGSADQPLRPTFSWLPDAQAASYRLELALDAGFLNQVFTISELTSTVYTLPIDLSYNTPYFWRVQAENACGLGSFSPTYTFTTRLSDPPPPRVIYLNIIRNQATIPLLP